MSESMKLRFATEYDAEKLLKIYEYYVQETNITFEYDIPSVEEFKNRIKEISSKYPYLVLEENNEIIGYAYANTFKNRSAYDWTVEISIYLDVNSRGKGIGNILYNKLEQLLIKQGIVNIEACITYPNERSEEFHKKNGFKKVAHFTKVGYKFKKWHDVIWYEKNIGDYKENMPNIKNIKEIIL